MAKAISVILNLRDNASKGLIGVANRTKGVTKEMKGATRTVVSWKNSFNKSLDSMTSKVVKWGSATVGAIAGFAAKTGFSEAMDLEGYRMQLETATKDTEKAASIMKYAIDLANKTPFEGGQLVEGAAKFEAMGMSAKKWLTLTGDMAAATNKDFDQATEALIDAQTGELERLKEFGVTKAMIQQQAEDMFHDVQVVNNKGQIVDQEKFNEAMIQLMKDKYTGGMERQATTLKGVFSTITGVTKSALAKIAGMNEDGSVRAGSAFDLIRQKAVALSEKLQQWQSDGTLDQIANKFTTLVQSALDFAENVGGKLIQALDWISQHSEGVKDALTILGVAFAAFKIIGFIGNVVYAVHTLAEFGGMLKIVGGVARSGLLSGLTKGTTGLFNFTSKVVDLVGKTGTGIIGLVSKIGAGTLGIVTRLGSGIISVITKVPGLIQNFGTGVLTIVTKVGGGVIGVVGKIGGGVVGLVGKLATVNPMFLLIAAGIALAIAGGVLLYKNWDKVCAYATKLKNWVVGKFNAIRDGITGAFDTVKSKVKDVFDWFASKFEWISDKISWLRDAASNLPIVGGALEAIGIGSNASGTPYWRGGLTRINERGGEIVDLPSGTRIIPHDVSKKQVGGRSVTVYITVQGNVIGKKEFMEETGEYVTNKVCDALDVV